MVNPMDGLEKLQADVFGGRLSRRSVLRRSLALGLSAPVVAGLLAACGGDDDDDGDTEPTVGGGGAAATATTGTDAAEATATTGSGTAPEATATTGGSAPEATATTAGEPMGERGGDGLLRLLWWQAPTILNPHLAQGDKDNDASQLVLEQLANWGPDGTLIPYLATEIPSLENGGVAEDGLSVTWKLREGVKWHDGEDFNAEDVRFTWEWAANPDTTATTGGQYGVVTDVEIIDDYTVKVVFPDPNPAWYDVFVGYSGMILPEHIFADFMGAEARNAPANLAPIGTGPYKCTEFRPGDVVLYDMNADYWDPGKPHFDSVELKGGGDAIGAARAAIVSEETDWAWNIQAEPLILQGMIDEGTGRIVTRPGSSAERVMINFTDPRTEVDGAFSEPGTEHPLLSDLRVRQALAMSIERNVIAEQLYGEGSAVELGRATSNNLNAPERLVSPNTSWTYDIDAAKALLAEAGVSGGDILYTTTVNSVRQKTQEIVKQGWEELGFSVEIKAVDAAVYFSSDAGNPDTYGHFYADVTMYTNGPTSAYPTSWAQRYRSDEIAQKSTNWSGDNIMRWNSPEFDALHDQARVELDPDRQVELFVEMNDMSINEVVEIPLVHRASVNAASGTLGGQQGANFLSVLYDVKNWFRDE